MSRQSDGRITVWLSQEESSVLHEMIDERLRDERERGEQPVGQEPNATLRDVVLPGPQAAPAALGLAPMCACGRPNTPGAIHSPGICLPDDEKPDYAKIAATLQADLMRALTELAEARRERDDNDLAYKHAAELAEKYEADFVREREAREAAEAKLDGARKEVEYQARERAKKVLELTDLRAKFEQAEQERDEALEEARRERQRNARP